MMMMMMMMMMMSANVPALHQQQSELAVVKKDVHVKPLLS